MDRRTFLEAAGNVVGGIIAGSPAIIVPDAVYAQNINVVNHVSPRSRRRPSRESTRYIVLHNTEATSESSLNSITRYGSANYMIDTDGTIYRILGDGQLSHGAGRSMWNSVTDLNDHAINIEFVGYSRNPLTPSQSANGKKLIEQLQRKYRLDDQDVLTHAQVAYANPNRWYRRRHRGRKWDARRLAHGPERERLGLNERWTYDPDVRAGRLLTGPRELTDILYGTGPIELPESVETRLAPVRAAEENEPEALFATIHRNQTPWHFAGDDYADSTTVYFLPNGWVRRGDELRRNGFNFDQIQPGTRIAVGYIYGGHVKPERSAISIAGRTWSSPSTIYRFPDGRIVSGDDIDPARIPPQTLVLFQR